MQAVTTIGFDIAKLNNCLLSSRMLETNACLSLPAPVWPPSAPSCGR
jgi:hypothetical protein